MSLINQVLLDLEKRHASESELKPLPPYVRAVPARSRPVVRMIASVLAALFLAAMGVLIYLRGNAGVDNAPRRDTASIALASAQPPAQPMAISVSAQPVIVPAEQPVQTIALNPVSRLSEELTLVAPLAPRKEKTAATESATNPGIATSARQPSAGNSPPVEKPLKYDVANTPDIAAATPVAEPKTAVPSTDLAVGEPPAGIDKKMREVAPSEGAEIAFRRGAAQIQEGRANAAEIEFREALRQDPSHAAALQALLGLLLASGRNNEAEQLLMKALQTNPRQPRLAMVLARLEIERGEVAGAINTMVGVLPYVQSDADFYAFLAALLQREGRHREAVDYYRTALRSVPGNGVWMMGLGISLRASNQAAEARDAFTNAIDSKQLLPELQVFVERQLRELSAQKKK